MKFSVPTNFSSIQPQILIWLALFSPLPSFFSSPIVSIGDRSSILFLLSAGARELLIILLFINIFIVYLFNMFRTFKIQRHCRAAYLLPLLCIPSFIYPLVLSEFNATLYIVGMRYFTLILIPLALYISPPIITKNHVKLMLGVIVVYLLLCIYVFLVGFSGYLPYYGATFLGPRFPFVYENPIVSSMTFGAISLFCSTVICDRLFLRGIILRFMLLFISFIFLCLALYTGGRAGLLVAILCFCFALRFVVFRPSDHSYLNYSSRNRIVYFLLSLLVVLLLLNLASIEAISGRIQAQSQLESGIVDGVYGSRLEILLNSISSIDPLRLVVGNPGEGTNTAVTHASGSIISDSYITASLLSFAIPGLLLMSYYMKIVSSPYIPLTYIITFIVYSLSQNLPEILMAWMLINFGYAFILQKDGNLSWSNVQLRK